MTDSEKVLVRWLVCGMILFFSKYLQCAISPEIATLPFGQLCFHLETDAKRGLTDQFCTEDAPDAPCSKNVAQLEVAEKYGGILDHAAETAFHQHGTINVATRSSVRLTG